MSRPSMWIRLRRYPTRQVRCPWLVCSACSVSARPWGWVWLGSGSISTLERFPVTCPASTPDRRHGTFNTTPGINQGRDLLLVSESHKPKGEDNELAKDQEVLWLSGCRTHARNRNNLKQGSDNSGGPHSGDHDSDSERGCRQKHSGDQPGQC